MLAVTNNLNEFNIKACYYYLLTWNKSKKLKQHAAAEYAFKIITFMHYSCTKYFYVCLYYCYVSFMVWSSGLAFMACTLCTHYWTSNFSNAVLQFTMLMHSLRHKYDVFTGLSPASKHICYYYILEFCLAIHNLFIGYVLQIKLHLWTHKNNL